MKFGKMMILGTILAFSASVACATPLLDGGISGTGTGTILATQFILGNLGTSPKSPVGALDGDGTGDLSDFTSATAFRYTFGAPYSLIFASPTVATPVEFFSVTEDGETLKFYLTDIIPTSIVVGVNATTTFHPTVNHPAVTGTFSAEGYLTEAGFANTPVNFSLTNSSGGKGTKAFSFSIETINPVSQTPGVIPEPSSLALLGSGIVSAAGMMFRRRRVL